MKKYQHKQNWFLGSELKEELLKHLPNRYAKRDILEIGSFEGLSSVFFADNLLHNPESSLTCVDPFSSAEVNDHDEWLEGNEVEKRFFHNIGICQNSDKIKVFKTLSDTFFEGLDSGVSYDFIYIDGCHIPDQVQRDMLNSFDRVKVGGYIWMDDYRGNPALTEAIDTTLDQLQGRYEIVHRGYQLAFIRTK